MMGRKRGKGKPQPSPLDEFKFEEDERLEGWTPKTRLFVLAYLRHFNAARAVREAGYQSVKFENQATIAQTILKRPYVAAYIKERRTEMEARLTSSAERVLQELASVAFTRITDLVEFEDNPNNPGRLTVRHALDKADAGTLAAIRELEIEDIIVADVTVGQRVKIKLHPKTSALDTLAKHHKLIGADVDMNVTLDIGDRLQEAKRKLREARLQEEGAPDE